MLVPRDPPSSVAELIFHTTIKGDRTCCSVRCMYTVRAVLREIVLSRWVLPQGRETDEVGNASKRYHILFVLQGQFQYFRHFRLPHRSHNFRTYTVVTSTYTHRIIQMSKFQLVSSIWTMKSKKWSVSRYWKLTECDWVIANIFDVKYLVKYGEFGIHIIIISGISFSCICRFEIEFPFCFFSSNAIHLRLF